MSRDAATIARSLIGKLHPGWVLSGRGGVLDQILTGAARILADAEAQAEALMDETDPRNASNLLSDFERVLGPDRCGRDLVGLTVTERQQLAHQRWTSTGGQSIPYFISVAAKLGVPVEIEEYWPSKAGALRCGDRLIADGEQFLFTVHLEGGTVTLFRSGGSRAGDRLGTFTLSPVECELRRIKPAHTHIVFHYHELLLWDGEQVTWDDGDVAWGIFEG